jgi:hypothetical protein
MVEESQEKRRIIDLNLRLLKQHREVVYSEAFNILVDRVTGKRNCDPVTLQRSINRVKFRKEKLTNLDL